jgi:hypothetical protein
MPYIKPEDRTAIILDNTLIEDAGELNFYITTLIDFYINKNTKSYTTLNEVIGVLECAKLEVYRRIVAPYEDTKIEQNGDVYTA